MTTAPENLLVIADISSHHVAATVAALHPEHGEKVAAHKRVDCQWFDLSERGRVDAVAEAVRLACDSAGIEPWSVYLSHSDATVSSRIGTGWAAPGDELVLTGRERDYCLRRAREQATGADREMLDVIPIAWRLRSRDGEREVADPVGEKATHVTCEALLVSARRGHRDELHALAKGLKLELDAVIAQPVALYRGIAGKLRARGTQVVIDCGARHTAILVRRKDKLVHVEVHTFGGDDLTRRIAENLHVSLEKAEDLKREVDIGASFAAGVGAEGQQFIFSEIQERSALVLPAAACCADALNVFFKDRARDLRDHSHLGQQGQIHLVGRGANLGGLAVFLRDIFELPVVLGTGDRTRQPGEELDGLLTAGLVCWAGDHRRMQLAGRSAGFRKTASGLWSWLTKPMG